MGLGPGWSIHKSGGWRGQLDRVHRCHERLLNAVETGTMNVMDLSDFAFAFFQNCYHLRDWMEKSKEIKKSDLGDLFKKTPELQICRDICNGTKHFTIDRQSVDADFSILREYDPSAPSSYRLLIITNKQYDLIDLATKCLRAWDNFVGEVVD
jgi:hypothetical protein